MKFLVTKDDILHSSKSVWGKEQDVLYILKQKGAPIEGNFFLNVKRGYNVSRTEDLRTGEVIFEFREPERMANQG